jgi:hypothetical protein
MADDTWHQHFARRQLRLLALSCTRQVGEVQCRDPSGTEREPMVRGLCPGGEWIRTLSSSMRS